MNSNPVPNLADMQRACEKLAENHVPPGPDGKYVVFAQPGSIADPIANHQLRMSPAAMIEKLPRKVRRRIARAQKKALDHYRKTGEVVLPDHV